MKTYRYLLLMVMTLTALTVSAETEIEPDTSFEIGIEADSNNTVSIMQQEQGLALDAYTAEKNAYKNTKYWNRCRTKTFAGSVLASLGAMSFSYFTIIALYNEGIRFDQDYLLLIPGCVFTASSVPLYISAYKDRKRAKRSVGSVMPTRNYRTTGFRCEASVGITTPTDIYDLEKPLVGANIAVEGRSYLGNSNFDLGVKFSFENIRRRNEGYSSYISSNIFRMTVFSDYNFMKNSDITPFVGVGVGVGLPETVHIEPRAGVEFLHHHRLSLQWRKALTASNHYDICKHDNLGISYGYTF
ncbi:MAG: hypothetical protein Q4D33_00645 [Prevotellaceae bacterium]|nr:hypothetical protein [Prevotellaceae bacterium]